MAASKSGRGWWLAVPVLLFFLFTGLFWPFLSDEKEPVPRQTAPPTESVEIASWTWKKNRSGTLHAVYGEVRNLSDQDFKQVVLELRTQDENEQTIARYPITVNNLPAGKKKPFRKDVPRTGREAKGFLEVREAIP